MVVRCFVNKRYRCRLNLWVTVTLGNPPLLSNAPVSTLETWALYATENFIFCSPLGPHWGTGNWEVCSYTFEPLDVGTLDFSQPRQPGCLRTSTVRQVRVGLGVTASASVCIISLQLFSTILEYVPSSPLEPGASFSFELTEDRGAALVTKYSTYRIDTLVKDRFKEYTEHHYKSWVEFACSKRYGKDVCQGHSTPSAPSAP